MPEFTEFPIPRKDVADTTEGQKTAIRTALGAAAAADLSNVDNTSDADKPVSTAQQAALDMKADNANSYTRAELDRAFAIGVAAIGRGIRTDGTDPALVIPKQAVTDIAFDNFTVILPWLALPDYTPATDQILWTNEDGSNGVRILLLTTGALALEIGDGTDWTRYTTPTRTLADYADHTPLRIALVCLRSGISQFYVNGATWDTIDCSAQSDISLTTASDWSVLDAPGRAMGDYVRINRFASAAEIAYHSRVPDTILSLGTGSNSYTSDFSAGTDGWARFVGANTVLAGNQDGVFGEDNVLSFSDSNNGATGTAGRRITQGIVPLGNVPIRLKFKVYLPSGQNAKSITVRHNGGLGFGGNHRVFPPYDEWTNISLEGDTSASGSQTVWISLANATGFESWDSDGSVVHLKDIIVDVIGLAELIDLSASGATKPDLVGSNDATRGATANDTI